MKSSWVSTATRCPGRVKHPDVSGISAGVQPFEGELLAVRR